LGKILGIVDYLNNNIETQLGESGCTSGKLFSPLRGSQAEMMDEIWSTDTDRDLPNEEQ